ncbi:UNVERIFIED_CONTAM: hypothetical protein Scaly_2244600 [Sesamum calycinum]|uniref:ATP-dependent DNA helicase n=1 Tax=Sesamum calycinum TaxID=2727403 RepID=A0AAW2MC36_9LAMI
MPTNFLLAPANQFEASTSRAPMSNRNDEPIISSSSYFVEEPRYDSRYYSSIILHGGRLLQYVVDNYVKIEAQKLRWIRFHQNDIRAELYEGLQDCLNAGENNAGNVGRRIILPSSFTGSPRDMYQRYQDAMAIVQKFEDYDCVVRAEIPDKNEEPELYAAVLKHMIHGPCGQSNSNAPCMKNMSCKKGYPKPFAECTVQGNDSNDGCIILATATSGIAANLLPGGRTAHSKFKIPIKFEPMAMCRFSKQSDLCALINRASAIIWDEAPMANRKAFETVDAHSEICLE